MSKPDNFIRIETTDFPVTECSLEFLAHSNGEHVEILIDVRLARVTQRDGSFKWAIREDSTVLNTSGEWEWEIGSSSRTDEFLARCRFDSADVAKAFWVEGGHKSRYQDRRVWLADKEHFDES